MSKRSYLLLIVIGIVYFLVLAGLYVFYPHAKDTLIPQILGPIGIIVAIVGVVGLIRLRRRQP